MSPRTHTFIDNAYELKQRGLHLIRVCMNSQNRCAVFFDIDDTLLDAKNGSERDSFLQPIRPIVDLCKAALNAGLLVVIITARPDYPHNRTYTEQELIHHGIHYDLLYMYPNQTEYSNRSIRDFKTQCRRDALYRLQCDPLFAIGDRDWDFGKFGGIGMWLQE